MLEIERLKCQNCATIQEVYHKRCIHCNSENLHTHFCEPMGTVITFTTCYTLPQSLKHLEKVTFAIIELERGGRILGQIRPPESVDIGTQVEGYKEVVSVLPDGTEQIGWVFTELKNEK